MAKADPFLCLKDPKKSRLLLQKSNTMIRETMLRDTSII